MYDEIMELWKVGKFEPIAKYLNARGIYSKDNPRHPNRIGSYEWMNPRNNDADLVVLGVMWFPLEFRHTKGN